MLKYQTLLAIAIMAIIGISHAAEGMQVFYGLLTVLTGGIAGYKGFILKEPIQKRDKTIH